MYRKLTMEELERPDPESAARQEKLPLVLVLDNIRSGLNVGSIFRTADAFACQSVFLCGITAQPPHREILKTALGSTESVLWRYFPEVSEALRLLREQGAAIWAVEQGTPKTWLQQFQPDGQRLTALILGNEVDGVSEEALQWCDGLVEIPQFGIKHSLNVAVSAGIAVWELVRKIKLASPD